MSLKIYEAVKFEPLNEQRSREWKCEELFEWSDTNPNLFSLDFLREVKDEISWSWISEFRVFTSKEIKEFEDKINFYKFSCYQPMTPEIIERYQDEWDYNMLGSAQKLTEEFVWNHRHEVNWRIMVTHQHFSTDFWKKCLEDGVILSPWLRDEVRQKITVNEQMKQLKHFNK